jgi:hypothetical protein
MGEHPAVWSALFLGGDVRMRSYRACEWKARVKRSVRAEVGGGQSHSCGQVIVWGPQVMTMSKGGGAMPQRGGPWRLAGYAIPDGGRARGAGAPRELATLDGDRSLRWIVLAYVLALIGGGLVALVGLSEGWW